MITALKAITLLIRHGSFTTLKDNRVGLSPDILYPMHSHTSRKTDISYMDFAAYVVEKSCGGLQEVNKTHILKLC